MVKSFAKFYTGLFLLGYKFFFFAHVIVDDHKPHEYIGTLIGLSVL